MRLPLSPQFRTQNRQALDNFCMLSLSIITTENHLPETQRRAATHQQRTAKRRPRCPLRRRSTALSSGCACCQHRRDRPARTRRRPCGQTPSPTWARKSRRASSRGRKPHRESGGRAPTGPWWGGTPRWSWRTGPTRGLPSGAPPREYSAVLLASSLQLILLWTSRKSSYQRAGISRRLMEFAVAITLCDSREFREQSNLCESYESCIEL